MGFAEMFGELPGVRFHTNELNIKIVVAMVEGEVGKFVNKEEAGVFVGGVDNYGTRGEERKRIAILDSQVGVGGSETRD